MRRISSRSVALLAGLVALLSGCAGESPTSPSSGPGGGGGTGSCAVTVSLAASSVTPLAGSAVVIRATVTKNGAPLADGQSVYFTADSGYFVETSLPTASKVIVSGVADITLGALNSGAIHVKATYQCGSAQITVNFAAVPDTGPFVSSIVPNAGTCAGADTVTINGGRFGSNQATTRVAFGGLPATVVSVANEQIVVKTPARTLANPQVPEQVDVLLQFNAGSAGAQSVTVSKGYTYYCVDKHIFISSITPNSGTPDGGTTVTISGGNFGASVATTRVTFGGVAGSVTGVADNSITVTTPKRTLANHDVPETVDVAVTRDLGLVSAQSAVLPQAYTYRWGPVTGDCPTSVNLFIASMTPNTGTPDGGDLVTIIGGGFGNSPATINVTFGGNPAQVTGVQPTSITLSTPRHTLANPDVPETVDVVVTTDPGGPNCVSTRLANAFTYTRAALTPHIYSVSPVTGPNDVSTRVTIFGTGFQFPMQVFFSGAACGAQKVEAAVISIKSDTVVFQTPIASNGNVCLANQLVDLTVLNPTTGKTDTFGSAFKYYSCPTITAIEPSFGPYTGGTRVVITGHNFVEPVVISGAGWVWQVVSVSESEIIAVTGAAAPTGCADIVGPVLVTSTFQNCGAATGPNGGAAPLFTYQVALLQPEIDSFSPITVPEAGGLVDVYGKNFFGNLRVILHFPGAAPVSIQPTVISSTHLSFTAPLFAGTFNTVPCINAGVPGARNQNTPVVFDVKNITTGCIASDTITYIPADVSCQITHTVTAAFNAVNGAATSLTVTFTDASTASPGPITSWLWNFGDASPTSNAQNPPPHVFPGAGPYTVSLTVGDGTVTNVTSKSITPP